MEISHELFEEQLQKLQKHGDKADFETLRNFLRTVRKTHAERWDTVVLAATTLLQKHASKLVDVELWDIHEQLVIAALHVGNQKLAEETLAKIQKRFGKTGVRVRRLIGYSLEAQEKFAEAEKIYKDILQEDPANHYVMKRQIAMRKARGKTQKAIQLLNEYLQIFMGDVEAWQELADLYVSKSLLKQATFCYEELILASPQNHHFYSKYAEILYSIGGAENLKLARKYFCKALELCDRNNSRALYGILLTAQALSRTKQDKDRDQNNKIYEWALGELLQIYKQEAPDKVQLISSIFPKSLDK